MALATAEHAAALSRGERRHLQRVPRRSRFAEFLPKGNLLGDEAWSHRHGILQSVLLLHLPGLSIFGLWRQVSPAVVGLTMVPILVCLALGAVIRRRRPASFFTTVGIVYCSAALVGLSGGMIEAHFHFFVIIGFIALYQDWFPFLWNIAFTVLSHGLGSVWQTNLFFNHAQGAHNPWLWSAIHGVAVLAACVGVVLFWRTNEDEQKTSLQLTKELGEADRRQFTSELLVNLARRNQSMLYRQLDILNQLEEQERDPDALADLFRLDHLATRIRRNAESLLVLSGEEPARVWSTPVRLVDVVRASIAETEDLDRVTFVVDERLLVRGSAVTDITHLLAELIENAVRSSPPESTVTIRSSPSLRPAEPVLLAVEDWGVGMPAEELAEANAILADPGDLDSVVSRRLGLHVVSRLAHRHGVQVSLSSPSGSGMTAMILLPLDLFAAAESQPPSNASVPGWTPEGRHAGASPGSTAWQDLSRPRSIDLRADRPAWDGWWTADADASANGHQPMSAAADPSVEPVDVLSRTVTRRELELHDVPADVVASVPGRAARQSNGWRANGWQANGRDLTGREHGGTGREHGLAVNGTGRRGRGQEPPTGSVPVGRPAGSATASDGGHVRLARRTPQASLAPELRRGQQPAGDDVPHVLPSDAARARDALSRYQASRQAALAKNDPGEDGTS